MSFEPGDVVLLKTDKPTLTPPVVTIVERSGRYAGWTILFSDGCHGIALDSEIKGKT